MEVAETLDTTKTLVEKPGTEEENLGLVDPGKQLGLGFSQEVSSEMGDGEEEIGIVVGDDLPFAVGDFVWAKIRGQPWWPARVCDPSLASQLVVGTPKRKGQSVLVAYFGREEATAWCLPSHLKPFRECFSQMASQTSSKSFVAALEKAVEEFGRCLELEMACSCVKIDARDGFRMGGVGLPFFVSYEPKEFLEMVCDVAKDATVVDMLEVVVLRSWVVALGRREGQKRRGFMDLIDKIDLDAPPGELLKDPDEEDCLVTGSTAMEMLETSAPVEVPESVSPRKLHQRKRRSMAALIAKMDLNTVEVSDEDEDEDENVEATEEEKPENKKACDRDNSSVGIKEDTNSGKRERKKSKYLSPPYTHLSGVGPMDAEMGKPKKNTDASRELATGSSEMDKSSVGAIEKEDDKKSPVFKIDKIDSTSANEIFSELLTAATDVLHLKWNRSAKTIRGFFATYRSSMYSSGSEFEAYQKHLSDACCMSGNCPTNNEEGLTEVKSGKTKGRATEEIPSELACSLPVVSEQQKSGSRRKTKKNRTDAISPLHLEDEKKSSSEKAIGSPRRKRTDEAKEAPFGFEKAPQRKRNKKDRGNAATNTDKKDLVEKSVTGLKRKMRSEASNGIEVNIGAEIVYSPALKSCPGKTNAQSLSMENGETPSDADNNRIEDRPEQQRNSADGLGPDISVDMEQEISNGSGGGKSLQKMTKKEGNNFGRPGALFLTFSEGTILPSKDELISTFRQYGDLIESEIELLADSHFARVVFARSSDAERAFSARDMHTSSGLPAANYRLRYLPGYVSSPSRSPSITKPPLPYIQKSLERMISTLKGASSPEVDVGPPDALKPEARENLVGEMQGLLTKVNKLLTGPAPSTSS